MDDIQAECGFFFQTAILVGQTAERKCPVTVSCAYLFFRITSIVKRMGMIKGEEKGQITTCLSLPQYCHHHCHHHHHCRITDVPCPSIF